MNIFQILDIGFKYTFFRCEDFHLIEGWQFLTVNKTQTATWFGSEEFGKFFSLN